MYATLQSAIEYNNIIVSVLYRFIGIMGIYYTPTSGTRKINGVH